MTPIPPLLTAPQMQPVTDAFTEQANINLFVQREDLLHPIVSGNKWYKLKWNLLQARQLECNTLLSFGGAYSNHIHALSAAAKLFGFTSIGVIRGDELADKSAAELSPTLTDAKQNGMHLVYISRTQYRDKASPEFLDTLKQRFGNFYCIPEGGNNILGIKGCAEMARPILEKPNLAKEFSLDQRKKTWPDWVCMASGTGCSIAGLVYGLAQQEQLRTKVLGINVLKGAEYIESEIESQLSRLMPGMTLAARTNTQWLMNHDYHFGGYGKVRNELLDFMAWFSEQHQIALDQVYTGKLFYAVYDLIKKGFFAPGAKLVIIHSGGLQGARRLSPAPSESFRI